MFTDLQMFITLHFYFSSFAYSSAFFPFSYIKHYYTFVPSSIRNPLWHCSMLLRTLSVKFQTSCSNILFQFTSGTMLTFTRTLKHLFPVYSFLLAKQLNHSCFSCYIVSYHVWALLHDCLSGFDLSAFSVFFILFSCIILFDWSLDLCWIIFSAVIHLQIVYLPILTHQSAFPHQATATN